MMSSVELQEVRGDLKKWEAAFYVVHQRKPEKNDIAQAPKDIRDKYRLYFDLKKQQAGAGSDHAAPSSKQSAEKLSEHTSNVWGVELNKTKAPSADTADVDKSDTSQVTLNKLGAKLFQNFSKKASSTRKPKGVFQRLSESSASCKESESEVPQNSNPDNKNEDSIDEMKFLAQGGTEMNENDIKQAVHPTRSHNNETADDHSNSDFILKGAFFRSAEELLKKKNALPKAKCSFSSRPRLSFLGRLSGKVLGGDDADAEDGPEEENLSHMKHVENDGLEMSTSSPSNTAQVVNRTRNTSHHHSKMLQKSNLSSMPSSQQPAGEPYKDRITTDQPRLPYEGEQTETMRSSQNHSKVSATSGNDIRLSSRTNRNKTQGKLRYGNYQDCDSKFAPETSDANFDKNLVNWETGTQRSSYESHSVDVYSFHASNTDKLQAPVLFSSTQASHSGEKFDLTDVTCERMSERKDTPHSQTLALSANRKTLKPRASRKSHNKRSLSDNTNVESEDTPGSVSETKGAGNIYNNKKAGNLLETGQVSKAAVKKQRKRKCDALIPEASTQEISSVVDTTIQADQPETMDETEDAVFSQKAKTAATAGASRKRSAASLNDNFVCLNMKRKAYRRKGAGMTEGQRRKKQWKAKMSARSQSFGSNKCFKCGQEGHWANKCTGKRTGTVSEDWKSAPPVDNTPVEESEFPSLRQAALMARGIKGKLC